jgi:hypothetical protein
MAGDSNTGGGGSVYWSLDVNNADDAKTKDTKIANKRHHQEGKDCDGNPANGDVFTVTIRIPQGQTPGGYVTGLQNAIQLSSDNAHVWFTVPIEDLGAADDHRQINIKWGDQSQLARHGNAAAKALARGGTATKRSVKKASAKKFAAKKSAAKNGKAKARRGKRR